MEHVSNKEKAKELGEKYIDNFFSPKVYSIEHCLLDMAQWKDEQFESAINEIKANIIEKRDNKEYYETNRKTTLNWILRLIDECCTKGK